MTSKKLLYLCHTIIRQFKSVKPTHMNTLIKYFTETQRTQFSFEQIEQANQAIENFFDSQSLPSLRDGLRTWYEAAISSNYPPYESGEERSNLFNLYHQLEVFIEAAYILNTAKYAESENESKNFSMQV
jgi:hypothetical protein